jgi:methylmalonyl-CoA/ethylmalonyl-CoA epimerase
VTHLRRLDHVAVVVRSTEDALRHYQGQLGLRVHSTEELEDPPVRLTYLDVGNAFLQLIEPLDRWSALGAWLDANGEGLHHICFGVDDVPAAVTALGVDGEAPLLGSGRGRISAFVGGPPLHGVRIECTEFSREHDVDLVDGWLPPDAAAEPIAEVVSPPRVASSPSRQPPGS